MILRFLKLTLSCLSAAVLLAACGDDNKIQFTQVVTFGDSLSDGGAYRVGSVAQLGGGKFTVNGTDDKVWSEALAANLGLPVPCVAQTGLLPNIPGLTGAPVTDVAACNNYAQGSSRVSAVGLGPRGVALQKAPYNDVNLGLIADSIRNQMSRHVAKVGVFGASDLVTVNGGGNDFFMQLTAVSVAADGGAAAAGAGAIAGWPAATLAAVSAGGLGAVNAASAAAVAGMGQAGAELAGYVKDLLVAKGAKYIVVRNLADLNVTPFGFTFDAGTRQLSTAMTTAFNAQLKQGLTGLAGVVYFDDYARTQSIAAKPTESVYSNVTSAACGPDAFSAPTDVIGNSIICNARTLVKADTSKYVWADSVHPTPFAHQDTANFVVTLMRGAGWYF
jgi:outer membrane lipase/esterase